MGANNSFSNICYKSSVGISGLPPSICKSEG
jgi:hypothetical protein